MMTRISDVQVKETAKSIRDVPVPDRSRRSEYFPPADARTKKRRSSARRTSTGGLLWKIFFFVAVVVFIVFGYVSSTYLASLKVFVTPITYTESYTALPITIVPSTEIGASTTQSEYVIPYSLVSIKADDSIVLEANASEDVKTKAVGTLTVFNSYSATPVNLVAQTRFESTSGKIYRIAKAVSIPGFTKTGTTTIPGKLDITVTADAVGADYNIERDDFTIPGFKGNPRFEKVYARSKTSISGGFVGTRPIITEASKENAISDVRLALKQKIDERVITLAPAGSVYFLSLARLSYTEPQITYASSTAIVKVGMNAEVPVFLRRDFDLGATLSLVKAPNTTVSNKAISDVSKLSVVPQGKPILAFAGKENIVVTGNAVYTAIIPEEDVKDALVGAKRNIITSILSRFESVESARVKFVPFWLSSAPKSKDRIHIIDTKLSVD